ncbi:glycosyltransferase family 39 protein [Nostoc sp. MS1]|uniref:glycosyltransferase family 39 protein n=1 Tax=Nostoc sp. MS1 TaxID=2764711 RepID=UPI001CC5D6F0|nr:glycosyltransferase family 39 protein [Nostoc sp. MS1]BCL38723.1 hypothetical protein NSMS1_51700 [Nostoc sp. MS1]
MNIFKLFIISVLIVGIFFRFINIDKKVFWGDETSTLVRIFGYTFQEMRQNFLTNYQLNVADLQKYQRLRSDKGTLEVIKGLAVEEPQLPPAYFILLRSWVQLFSSSIISARSFSAVISLLALPAIYWLCRELFPSSNTAWMALGLLAISPFQVLYAQEARPQSLWTVTILLSSAALLKSLRQGTKLNWLFIQLL